jgi:CheY-like chemotaxis protein
MRRILVVDDEPDILELLIEILRLEGYAMLAASDGVAALDVLDTHGVDLVITDTMMPRLNGVSLIRSMHERPELRSIPVIVMSAAGRPNLDGLDHCCIFLPKPFDLTRLLNTVAKAVEGNLPEGEA